MIAALPHLLLQHLMVIARRPAVRLAAFVLFPYAALLVGMDIAARYGDLTGQELPVQFLLSQDQSFGEYLEYALMVATAIMLGLIWRSGAPVAYGLIAALFLILAGDNAFEIHERFGFWVAPLVPSGLPMQAHHLGEPIMFVAIGILWLAAISSTLRAGQQMHVLNMLTITLCIGATAFFGIFVDAAVNFGSQSETAIQIEAFIEDGGEFAMIVMTFLAVIGIYERHHQTAIGTAPALSSG